MLDDLIIMSIFPEFVLINTTLQLIVKVNKMINYNNNLIKCKINNNQYNATIMLFNGTISCPIPFSLSE